MRDFLAILSGIDHWEIKGRFRKRVVLANVPSFRFSFLGNIRRNHPFGNHPCVNTKKGYWEIKGRFLKGWFWRTYPRSGFRSWGTSAKTTLLETTLVSTPELKTGKTLKVARLQSEFWHEEFFELRIFYQKNAPKISPKMLSLYFGGSEKNPAKIPAKFPAEFPCDKLQTSPTSVCGSAQGEKTPIPTAEFLAIPESAVRNR